MEWCRDGARGTGEGPEEFRQVVRAVLLRERAPEVLRARIAAMLAVEAGFRP